MAVGAAPAGLRGWGIPTCWAVATVLVLTQRVIDAQVHEIGKSVRDAKICVLQREATDHTWDTPPPTRQVLGQLGST